MHRIAAAIGLSYCFAITPASAADSYLCVPDLATGFKFNKPTNSWNIVNFKTDKKYFVVRPKDSWQEKAKWIVKEIGSEAPMSFCKNDFDEYGGLLCEGFMEFRMNKNDMRYLNAYLLGFVGLGPGNAARALKLGADFGKPDLFKEGGDTPFIEIGKCSSL